MVLSACARARVCVRMRARLRLCPRAEGKHHCPKASAFMVPSSIGRYSYVIYAIYTFVAFTCPQVTLTSPVPPEGP